MRNRRQPPEVADALLQPGSHLRCRGRDDEHGHGRELGDSFRLAAEHSVRPVALSIFRSCDGFNLPLRCQKLSVDTHASAADQESGRCSASSGR